MGAWKKIICLGLLVCSYFCALNTLWAQSFVDQKPKVVQLRGKAEVILSNGKRQPLMPGFTWHDQAQIETFKQSEVKISLNSNSKLNLKAQSSLEVSIASDNSRILFLKSGSLRMTCPVRCPTVWLKTEVVQIEVGPSDVILNYDPRTAKTSIEVIQGELKFSGLENFDKHIMTSGTESYFKGVLEDGKPAFDELLKGKRAARGVLGPLKRMSSEKLKARQDEIRTESHQWIVTTTTLKREKDHICTQPLGKLNQCAWICKGSPKGAKGCNIQAQGVQCIRYRCDANGQWSDAYELSGTQSICTESPIVSDCNY